MDKPCESEEKEIETEPVNDEKTQNENCENSGKLTKLLVLWMKILV